MEGRDELNFSPFSFHTISEALIDSQGRSPREEITMSVRDVFARTAREYDRARRQLAPCFRDGHTGRPYG